MRGAGGGWDEVKWGGQLPDASWIDSAVGSRPAFVTRMDAHMGLASSEALKRAGITSANCTAAGGQTAKDTRSRVLIDCDSEDRPTGVLRESAMPLVLQLIPEPSVAERQAALSRASQYALSRGVTTVIDMGRSPFAGPEASWSDLHEVYLPFANSGELPIRVCPFMPLRSW